MRSLMFSSVDALAHILRGTHRAAKYFWLALLFSTMSWMGEVQAEFGAWSVGYFRDPGSKVHGVHFQGHRASGWGGYFSYGSGTLSGRSPRGSLSLQEDFTSDADFPNFPRHDYTERSYLAAGPSWAMPLGDSSFFSVQLGYAYYRDTFREYIQGRSDEQYAIVETNRLGGRNSLDAGVGFLLRGFYIGASYAIDEWRITIGGGWR